MRTKIIIVSILMLMLGVSCDRESIEDYSSTENVANKTTTSAALAAVNPLSMPSGWSQVASITDAKCFRKNNSDTYVVAINLKNGTVKVRPVYDIPNPAQASATTPNPIFNTGNIVYWQGKDQSAFAVANCAFFDGTLNSQFPIGTGTTTLPFVLKRSGTILASGSNLTTEPYQRYLALGFSTSGIGYYSEIGDNGNLYVNSNLYTQSQTFYSNKGGTVIGGLNPVTASKNPTSAIGRTMVGIKDCDNDGYKEALYILIARAETQQNAYNVLKTTFACDQVIMFDGSGSSQLICQQQELVQSTDVPRRKFPVALQVGNY